MIDSPNFLLGMAYAIITVAREHMIIMNDEQGIAKIEEQYQQLKSLIEKHYYTNGDK